MARRTSDRILTVEQLYLERVKQAEAAFELQVQGLASAALGCPTCRGMIADTSIAMMEVYRFAAERMARDKTADCWQGDVMRVLAFSTGVLASSHDTEGMAAVIAAGHSYGRIIKRLARTHAAPGAWQ